MLPRQVLGSLLLVGWAAQPADSLVVLVGVVNSGTVAPGNLVEVPLNDCGSFCVLVDSVTPDEESGHCAVALRYFSPDSLKTLEGALPGVTSDLVIVRDPFADEAGSGSTTSRR